MTNETKVGHTPGPWRVAPASDYPLARDLNIDAGTRGFVCHAGWRGEPEAEANARLIAAAPDLLAALEELVMRSLDADMGGPCWCVGPDRGLPEHEPACLAARAAIAKARGEV